MRMSFLTEFIGVAHSKGWRWCDWRFSTIWRGLYFNWLAVWNRDRISLVGLDAVPGEFKDLWTCSFFRWWGKIVKRLLARVFRRPQICLWKQSTMRHWWNSIRFILNFQILFLHCLTKRLLFVLVWNRLTAVFWRFNGRENWFGMRLRFSAWFHV